MRGSYSHGVREGATGYMRPMLRFTLLLLVACGSRKFPASDDVYAEALARFDGNADGTLSRDEYDKFDPLPETFDTMDKDRDGKVNVEEFKYFVLSNQPRALVSRASMWRPQ